MIVDARGWTCLTSLSDERGFILGSETALHCLGINLYCTL
jgi:hypothetical protein